MLLIIHYHHWRLVQPSLWYHYHLWRSEWRRCVHLWHWRCCHQKTEGIKI